jgi:hypothetical protein
MVVRSIAHGGGKRDRHHHSRSPLPVEIPRYLWRLAYKFSCANFSRSTNKSCQTSNRTLALLNSLWHSTLVRPIAVSHTVFWNEDEFLRFLGLRSKFFISLYRSALTGPRFPAQPPTGGDAKVPSLLYYDKTGNVRAAGAEVLTENALEDALSNEWMKAEWLVIKDVKAHSLNLYLPPRSRWKLHLRPKHLASSINPADDLPPLPPGKSAVDVLTDFIDFLFRCAKTYIQERHLAATWSTIEDSTEYIFTHPNGWEGVQQQLYRRAIERAGLIPSTPEGQSRVHLLTEGEASLHFCVSDLLNAETAIQAAPQGVVIIDAGGGTIDLSMFSMTSAPISGEEIAPAECMRLSQMAEFLLTHLYSSLGRLQGGVFVTRRARAMLQSWWLAPSIALLVTNPKTLKQENLQAGSTPAPTR